MDRKTTLRLQVAAAYLLAFLWPVLQVPHRIYRVADAMMAARPALASAVHFLGEALGGIFGGLLPALLTVLTVGAGAIAVLRVTLRAAPGTRADPLVHLRDFCRRHARVVNAALWAVPQVLTVMNGGRNWRYLSFLVLNGYPKGYAVANVLATFVGALALTFAGKKLVAALDAVADRAPAAPSPVGARETVFRAVAITPRSGLVVCAALAASLAMIAFLTRATPTELGGPVVPALLALYAAGIAGASRWYQRASTIAVGADGVRIGGTSKTEFFAYRSFDAVKVHGPTLTLLRRGRGAETVIVLQLHGDDVHRGEQLAERIRAALAASRTVSGAESLVAAPASAPGRAALGRAADYRSAALSREQLWEIVEADGTASDARAAAADLLAVQLEASDRARLRLAAAHLADPRVRVALEAHAGQEPGGLAAHDEVDEVDVAEALPAGLRGALRP